MLMVLLALFRLSGKPDWASQTDAELLQQYREKGVQGAFTELYGRYAHVALGVCLKYLKNTALAEDAAMEVFEKLILDLRHHEVDNFKAWLYTVCKNHCLMQLRSAKSKQSKTSEYEGFVRSLMETGDDLHLTTDDGLEKQLNLMLKALDLLPQEQQQCIRLFYLEKKSYKEIETITGYPDTKVKSYIQNGKRNLKIQLTGKA